MITGLMKPELTILSQISTQIIALFQGSNNRADTDNTVKQLSSNQCYEVVTES